MNAQSLWTPPPKLWVAEILRSRHPDLKWIAFNALSESAKEHFLSEAERSIAAVAGALKHQRDGTDPFAPSLKLAQRIAEAEKPGEPA